jgi:hypothetical protein
MFSGPTTTGIAEGVWDREFTEKAKGGRLWQYVAFSVAGGTREALGGKTWRIAALTPPPATTFRQQTRVVEHKG